MSILKFKFVKNIGRLVNCTGKGEQYRHFTLLHAENTRGKTTLSAILRSLKTGEANYIKERKSVGQVSDPEVEIVIDGGVVRYANGQWNKSLPELEIFDSTFIAQNIHAGEYIDTEHKRRLLQVIIGPEGVLLAQKVEQLDEALKVQDAVIREAKKIVQTSAGTKVDVDEFVALVNDDEIKKKIATKTAELGAAQNAKEIEKRPLLEKIVLSQLPSNFEAILVKTLHDVSIEAEGLVRAQLLNHAMDHEGEAWLERGNSFANPKNTCPFCAQSLEGLKLIGAYKSYFQVAYTSLREEVAALSDDLDEAIGESARAAISNGISRNERQIDFWTRFISEAPPQLDFESKIATPLISFLKAASALIEKKNASLLAPLDFKTAMQNEIGAFAAVAEAVAAYNHIVEVLNAAITNQKTVAKNANLKLIEDELTKLKLVELRNSPKVKTECETYLSAKQKKDGLQKDKDAAKKILDAHSEKMFLSYEETINKLLKRFGAGFQLAMKASYVGRVPSSSIQLVVDEHPIDAGNADSPLGTPSFRTVMSASDKSTLALAFFLARFEHDPNKNNCILVFDDPFNSQDASRREHTAQLLCKFGAQAAQLILLSHDAQFLALVYGKLDAAQTRVMQLARINKGRATDLMEWEINSHLQDNYTRYHASLRSYQMNGAKSADDRSNAALRIRLVLEGHIRRTFPGEIPQDKWLGDMIALIRDGKAAAPLLQYLDEIKSVNEYSKRYHHENGTSVPNAGIPDDGELSTFVEQTLDIVGGY